MMLSKIVLENYRGFYGTDNIIEFECKENTDKKINIVIARNDTGKTTLLNSIYWCFYGDEHFSTHKAATSIPANKRINEIPIGDKMRVSVSITLNDKKGPKYQITRIKTFKRLMGDNRNDLKTTLDSESFKGSERRDDSSGWKTINDKIKLENIISKNIPKGISYFFFLDGEQLKAIFSSDINYQIKKSIEKVANIESLDNMINNLKKLRCKYATKGPVANSNYGIIQRRIEECDERKNQLEEKRKEKIDKLAKTKEELNAINDYLQKNNEEVIRELSAYQQRIISENERINDQRKNNDAELSKATISAYVLVSIKPMLQKTCNRLKDIIKGGNFPPAVDPARAKQILKRKECICGTKIKTGSLEEKNIKVFTEPKSYKSYVRIISEGDSCFPEMIDSIDRKIETIVTLRKKISSDENLIGKNNDELESINTKLKNSDNEEIRKQADLRDMRDREKTRLGAEIAGLDMDITNLKERIKEDEMDRARIRNKEAAAQSSIMKADKCTELIKYGESIKESILKSIKDSIESATAQNFLDLHWRAKHYERVKILDDFSLSIKDAHKGNIINVLSQGAALCFGLAFMSALRNYSGYDVPIIIDSPVGKIDEGNRENIARKLPEQLKDHQIIFLVTGTEYTSVFKEFIENKIAKIINLKYNDETGEVEIENECN